MYFIVRTCICNIV